MVAPLQSASGSASSALTVSATFGSNLSAGSKILAWFVATNTSAATPISTVKDTAGNSLTQAATPVSGGSGGNTSAALYFLDVPAGDVGGTTTITATFGGTSADLAIIIQEVPGLLAGNTTACMDGSPAQVQETPAASQTQPAYSSTASGEYLTSFLGDNGNSVTWALAGYTLDTHSIQGSATADCIVGYKASTNGAETGTWTTANTPTGSCLIVVAFQLAPAGGAGNPPQQELTPPGLQSPMAWAPLMPPPYPQPPPPLQAGGIETGSLVPPGLQSPMAWAQLMPPPYLPAPPPPAVAGVTGTFTGRHPVFPPPTRGRVFQVVPPGTVTLGQYPGEFTGRHPVWPYPTRGRVFQTPPRGQQVTTPPPEFTGRHPVWPYPTRGRVFQVVPPGDQVRPFYQSVTRRGTFATPVRGRISAPMELGTIQVIQPPSFTRGRTSLAQSAAAPRRGLLFTPPLPLTVQTPGTSVALGPPSRRFLALAQPTRGRSFVPTYPATPFTPASGIQRWLGATHIVDYTFPYPGLGSRHIGGTDYQYDGSKSD